jgi:outer membrane immunogenic protein
VSTSGFIGGGRVGANYHVGPYVFGFEGDFAGMTLKGSGTVIFTGTTPASSPGTTVNYKTTSAYKTTSNWVTTFTGKVGYAFDRVLAYGKAGAAIEQDGDSEASTTTYTATTSPNPPSASMNSTTIRTGTATRFGWTAGVGLEYAFTNNWWAFVEYDHLGFLSQLMNFVSPVNNTTTTREVSLNVDRVVGGVDYHF